MKHLFRAALALACSLVAGAACGATLTATPATALKVLASAQPGDVVQFQAGDYGDLTAWNLKKAAPGVTVQPAPGAAVTLSSINANGSSYLTFSGFDVTLKTQTGLQAGSGAAHIVFDRMKVHHADASTLTGAGFQARLSSYVTVQDSEFYWSGIGGNAIDSDHVTITGNQIHDVNVDGIDLAGVTDAVVAHNVIHDQHPTAGDHPDGIQWWSTAATPTSGLEIAFNHIERAAGGIPQGIFGEDGANVSIHDNELLGTMYNGIGLARTKGAEISHNFVAGYPDMDTRIIVRGGCDAVKIADNTAQAVVNYVVTTEPPCTNVTIAGNTTIPAVQPGDLTALNAWKGVATSPPPPPLVDPLQATVDGLKTQLTALQAQSASAAQQAAAAQAALAAAQAKIAKALADLN